LIDAKIFINDEFPNADQRESIFKETIAMKEKSINLLELSCDSVPIAVKNWKMAEQVNKQTNKNCELTNPRR